jgi:hypothetical protein
MAPTTISLSDIEALAGRLLARGKSRLLDDMPDLQADLLLASRLLTRWIRAGSFTRYFRGPFTIDDGDQS